MRRALILAVTLLTCGALSGCAGVREHLSGEPSWLALIALLMTIVIGTLTLREKFRTLAKEAQDQRERHTSANELHVQSLKKSLRDQIVEEEMVTKSKMRDQKIDEILMRLGTDRGTDIFGRMDEQDIALAHLLSTLGGFITHSEVGFARADHKGCYYSVNVQWCRLTGLSETESKGDGWRNALHPEDAEKVIGGFENAVASCRDFRSVHRYMRPDGEIVNVRKFAHAIHGAKNECLGFVIFTQEVEL